MNFQKHKHLPVFLALAIVLIGFVAFLSYRYHQVEANDSTVKVHLKWLHNAQFAGMYLAKSDQLYSKAGLTVQFIEPNEDNRSAVDLILEGKNDFAIMSPMELLDAVAQGKPIKAVAAIYQESPSAVLSLPEANINKPGDLRNKVLGTSRSELFSFAAYQFLFEKYQIPTNTISYKTVGFNAVENLINKDIDAAAFYRTQAYFLKDSAPVELNIIKPEDFGVHSYNDVIVTSTKLIEANPELVKSFIVATLSGWKEALDNPAAGVQATLSYTHDEQVDAKLQQFVLSASSPLIRPEGIKNIGQMDIKRWQEIYKIYKDSVVAPDFDVTNAYTLKFLP